ncbi:MAG: succinate dehydrogenase cytochrome b subunit [Deltaproteobacteria bacterium]|nr:succinate dehydrogenase cytochrome b subunit [Deltaproteobacteria bacterium]
MNWFIETISSSIGKKLLMAITGASFILFLMIHLIGNLTLYFGKAVFLSYVAHLHALGPLIVAVEIMLLILACIHVTTGTFLFFQNLYARPRRYAVKRWAGGRTIGSATMPYSGFIILAFIVLHLSNFHFVDLSERTIFDVISTHFSSMLYVFIYTCAVVVVAFHVSHGFWSLFQSLGANNNKYMPLLRVLGLIFAVSVAIGFGFIPSYVRFMI